MKKIYSVRNFFLISIAATMFFASSCSKKATPTPVKDTTTTPVVATPASIGLYEGADSIYKITLIAVSKIGTKSIDYGDIFDTGSGGMVMDADSLIPASMITDAGFVFSGDSIVVNGITITSQKSFIAYGADSITTDTVYGNLAYAPVTVGDVPGSTITIKRLPFFLYYKAVDYKGKKDSLSHDFDTFGVSDEYDATFPNGVNISSPFSYYDPGTGLTRGFKMPALGTTNFFASATNFTYTPSVLTLGLTASDLSGASGFTFNTLNFYSGAGYLPFLQATVTYNGHAFSSQVLYDTGTEPYSYFEDVTYTGSPMLLASGSTISLATTSGFTWSYTTTPLENLTYVENPHTTGGSFTIFGLEFFIKNSFMYDYTDHKLGVKNN